jgi:alpha-tubulin suppressor-like RCC1 family protein
MMRVWLAVLGLAGCDKLLSLGDIHPPPFVAASPSTIAAGDGHTCWIRSDGDLFCWGDNTNGQLGIASNMPENDVIAQVGDAKWRSVSADGNATCGIQVDGSLWCWGENANGELGTGDVMDHHAPTAMPDKWRAVSVSSTHGCAIRSDDSLWCWGNQLYGELGDGVATDGSQPPVSPEMIGNDFLAVATGTYHTCAIASDHTLSCWGLDDSGQVGNGTYTHVVASPTVVGSELWSQISTGRYHSCGITELGQLRCWGANYAGQLGIANESDANVPSSVFTNGIDGTDWTGVASGQRHTCAWTADQAHCFGDSSHGELTTPGLGFNPSPVAIANGPWVGFGLGSHHMCSIDSSSTLWCVGSMGSGQLGTGNTSQIAPEQVAAPVVWDRVRAGRAATCVTTTGHQLACGGDNFVGELGTGDRTSRQTLGTPSQSMWTDMAVGADYTCAFDTAGQLYCGGANDTGELGIGNEMDETTRQAVTLPGTGKVTSVIAASDHTCARDGSGHLYCWGLNDRGQLAIPASNPVLAPQAEIAVAANYPYSVAVGYGFTCAIADSTTNPGSGPVYCWGRNDRGQLGNGTTTDTSTPTPIGDGSFTTTFVKVYAGALHACALTSGVNGTAWCWGDSSGGQIISSGGIVKLPVAMSGQWEMLALGYYHTCALEPTSVGNHASCWGDNRRGQLGTNDPTRQTNNPPMRVNPKHWQSISAGDFHTCGVTDATDPRDMNNLYCWGSNDDGALLDGKGWTATPMQVPTP